MGYLSAEETQQVIQQYLSGETTAVIAKRFSVCPSSITKLLHRHDIHVRCLKEVRRNENPVYEDAFDEQNIFEDAAYWIGFLLADGSVSGNRIDVGLSVKDIHHLEKLRSFLRCSHKISVRPAATSKIASGHVINSGPSCRLAIRSDKLAADLFKFGVVPRKSLIAKAPAALLDNRDFWRGVFDGDGSMIWTFANGVNRPCVTLAGSKDIVSQFCQFIHSKIPGFEGKPRRVNNHYDVSTSGAFAVLLCIELYKGANIFLERKMAIVRSFKEYCPKRVRHAYHPSSE